MVPLVLLATHARAMTHGWDCVSCKTNSMLAGNFGTWRSDINLDDPWWIDTLATSYAAVFLNNFWANNFTGAGVDSKIRVARALKKRNPAIKVWFYQPADRLGDTPFIQSALNDHPEWWLRDDHGNVMPFGGPTSKLKQIDSSVVSAQDYFANLSISLFHNREEAATLLDGVFVDGVSFRNPNPVNISELRYQALFAGQMTMMEKLCANLKSLNGEGEAIGNPLVQYGTIGPSQNSSIPPGSNITKTLTHYDGAFDEMFGSFLTMEGGMHGNGEWDVEKMRFSFDAILNASGMGKTIVVHAFPGPATVPFNAVGPAGNVFHTASWAGATPSPTDPDSARAATQARLVQSLAPFLIVANEHVFFSYAWFYNIEDGYIPCPVSTGVECGMPHAWFPEFSKPLGAPSGPAETDAERNVWTRTFAHATVSVDLRNRTLSHIEWTS
jgi:hypothetical protein